MTLNPRMCGTVLLGHNLIHLLPQPINSMLNRLIKQKWQERHTPQSNSRRTPHPNRFVATPGEDVLSAVSDERVDSKGGETHRGNRLEEGTFDAERNDDGGRFVVEGLGFVGFVADVC
jgi:hypothetical protein